MRRSSNSSISMRLLSGRSRCSGRRQADPATEVAETWIATILRDERIEQQTAQAWIAIRPGAIEPGESLVGIATKRVDLGDLIRRAVRALVDEIFQGAVRGLRIAGALSRECDRDETPRPGRYGLGRCKRLRVVALEDFENCPLPYTNRGPGSRFDRPIERLLCFVQPPLAGQIDRQPEPGVPVT